LKIVSNQEGKRPAIINRSKKKKRTKFPPYERGEIDGRGKEKKKLRSPLHRRPSAKDKKERKNIKKMNQARGRHKSPALGRKEKKFEWERGILPQERKGGSMKRGGADLGNGSGGSKKIKDICPSKKGRRYRKKGKSIVPQKIGELIYITKNKFPKKATSRKEKETNLQSRCHQRKNACDELERGKGGQNTRTKR